MIPWWRLHWSCSRGQNNGTFWPASSSLRTIHHCPLPEDALIATSWKISPCHHKQRRKRATAPRDVVGRDIMERTKQSPTTKELFLWKWFCRKRRPTISITSLVAFWVLRRDLYQFLRKFRTQPDVFPPVMLLLHYVFVGFLYVGVSSY